MALDLTLYTNPMSRGQIARWMLEEVGEAYNTILLGYDDGSMKAADYRAINPMGKVPAIVHGGRVEAAVTNKALGFVVPEGREKMAGYGSFDGAIDALEMAVSGDAWICGEQFTAADVYVGAQVDWGLAFESIPSRPAFEAYASRLRERPAYQRQKEIDNALIAEMQKEG